MARRDRRDDDRGDRGPRGGRPGRPRTKKVCRFCAASRENSSDYKNVPLLKRYIEDDGQIRKARQTGTCRKHQNDVAQAVKRSREMALLPYVVD